MRQKSTILFFGIIVLLSIIMGLTYKYNVFNKYINLGLDLKGGLYVLLEAKDTPQAKVNDESMSSALSRLEDRVNRFGLSEPNIQRQGKNRIIVELVNQKKDPDQVVNTILKPSFLEMKDESGKIIVTGSDLKSASAQTDQNGTPAVAIKFNAAGTKKFGDFTVKNVKKNIYTYLDGNLIQTAIIDEPILGGDAQISNMKSDAEAKRISDLLNSGALPLKLDIKQKREVGPTLGKESLDKSIKAGVIGIIAILLFMAIYYRIPGLIADFALVVYTFLLLTMMAGFHATLTLPGLAGLLLSIGVAVDSNVIIFERIKEELRLGKSIRSAIDSGFNRALVTIIDSNMVHVFSGTVLYYFGTGPIKGFAVTLLLGVIASIVTAVVLTHHLLQLLANSKLIKSLKLYGA